jgi:hypothetical protein
VGRKKEKKELLVSFERKEIAGKSVPHCIFAI